MTPSSLTLGLKTLQKVESASRMLFRRGSSQRERFERLADEHFASIYGTSLRLTRDHEEAQDLAQEALVRAYEAYDRFDGRNFKAWVLRILTNLYINRYRRQQRRGMETSLDDEMAMEPAAPAEFAPDQQLLSRLLSGDVERALESLPEPFRVAVILSDLEGMAYEEIAEATEAPVGTVRSRIARGRSQLRRKLMDYALEEGYISEEDLK